MARGLVLRLYTPFIIQGPPRHSVPHLRVKYPAYNKSKSVHLARGLWAFPSLPCPGIDGVNLEGWASFTWQLRGAADTYGAFYRGASPSED